MGEPRETDARPRDRTRGSQRSALALRSTDARTHSVLAATRSSGARAQRAAVAWDERGQRRQEYDRGSHESRNATLEIQNRSHESQNRSHEIQNATREIQNATRENQNSWREIQNRSHESQNRSREIQNATRENQNSWLENQNRSHESQNATHEIQNATHENQNRTRENQNWTRENQNRTREIQNWTRENRNASRERHDASRARLFNVIAPTARRTLWAGIPERMPCVIARMRSTVNRMMPAGSARRDFAVVVGVLLLVLAAEAFYVIRFDLQERSAGAARRPSR